METRPARILIVDDEPAIVDTVLEFLSLLGHECTGTSVGNRAVELLAAQSYDLVLTDLHLGDITGMEVLKAVRHETPSDTTVVLMTAFPTIENAIEALKSGAEDYLLKPFSLETLELVVGRVLEKQRLARENISLRESLALYRASEALEAPLDLPEYLSMVLDVAVNELQGEAAQLALLGEGEETAVVRLLHRDQGSGLLLRHSEVRELAEQLQGGEGTLLRTRKEGGPLLALPLRTAGELVGLIAVHRRPGEPAFTPAQARALGIIGSGAAVAIKNARLYNSLQEQYLRTVRALVAAVEAKDPYTSGHSEMVSRYVTALAREAGLENGQVDGLRVAALLHDAGKIGIPEAVLLKPTGLTPEEYDIIKGHVAMSERIVEPLQLPAFITRAITEHHERLDGSGYPRALAGDEISAGGRMMAIADSWDAMMSDRVYRGRLGREKAVARMKEQSGNSLDDGLVGLFMAVLDKRDRGEIAIPSVHGSSLE
jgi:putative nucleotidyltransferase with HDIG domain